MIRLIIKIIHIKINEFVTQLQINKMYKFLYSLLKYYNETQNLILYNSMYL